MVKSMLAWKRVKDSDVTLLNDIDNTSIEIFTRDYFKESVFYSTNVEFEIMGPYYSLIAPVNCHKSG